MFKLYISSNLGRWHCRRLLRGQKVNVKYTTMVEAFGLLLDYWISKGDESGHL